MVKTKDSILSDYRKKAETQRSIIDGLKTKLNHISLSRLGLFLFEIFIVGLIIYLGFNFVFNILLVVPVLVFMFLVKKQAAVQEQLHYNEQLHWIFTNEINAITNRKNGYYNGEQYESEDHPYTSDLDIFGAGSLYAVINRCNTADGMDLLATHLSRPGTIQIIEARQQAIAELSVHIEKTFLFRAELHGHNKNQLKALQQKITTQLPAELAFTHKGFLKTYTRIVPFIMIAALAVGIYFGGTAWNIFVLLALFNIAYTFFHLKQINLVHEGFSGSAKFLNSFSNAIRWTEGITWTSAYILGFFKDQHEDSRVSAQIKTLSGIIQAFDARLNMLLGSILNVFLLWDFRCALRLDKWYREASGDLLQGLNRISQFEELISMATLSHNEPGWTVPVLSAAFKLHAAEMGHPLIPEDKRIYNDYMLLTHPTVDIVTGSNMAGKSTFLRTAGINMVLAYAGAVVCCNQLHVSIFSVVTYMRIKDSLNDQTSTFKAELNRLKMILDAISSIPNSLVLIDEMLRGTNSKDKYSGSKVFIQKLISQQVPSLFATHDLQLSEMAEQYPAQVRNYHFDIQITAGEMNFDYKLKHGACKTFNAAILLKQIGLSLEEQE
jgi:DNA mismatch repair ATPase MutS